MKRFLKFTLIGLGCLILLLAAALVAAPYVVDLNKYKGEISAIVKDATGRKLTIGNLDFSLFPGISVVAEKVSFSNAKGFGDDPMASLKRARVSLQLIPLLSKEIRIGHVTLEGADIRLGRNSDGVFCWDDLVPKPDKTEKKAAKSEPLPFSVAVSGITVKDTAFVWDDQQAGMTVTLKKINVETGTLAPVSVFPLKTSLTYALSNPELSGAVAVDGKVSVNLPKLAFGVQGLKLDTNAEGLVKAALKGIVDASFAGDDIKISLAKTTLDGCALNGDVNLKLGDKPFYQADLKVGDLDLDKYIPAPAEGAEQPAEPQQETGGGDAPLFDKEMLRGLHFDLKMAADSLTVKKVKMEKLTVAAKAENGVIDVNPLSFGFYSGSIDSVSKLDASGTTTAVQGAVKTKGVNLGDMVRDMANQNNVGGLLDLEAEIATSGDTADAMTKKLNGAAKFNLADGVFPGVDLFSLARKTQESKGKDGKIEAQKTDSTTFGQVSGSFVITDGIVTNEDLDVKAPGMRAFGHGGVSLVSKDIDYIVRVKLVATQEGQGGSSAKDTYGVMVPVRVGGTYDDPLYWVSLTEYVKALAGTAIELTGGVFNLGTDVVKGTGSVITGVGKGIGSLIPGFGGDEEKQEDKQ